MDDELMDELDEVIVDDDTTTQDNIEDIDQHLEDSSEDNVDIVAELLKTKGITDSSKIKFENDEGEIEEVDWNTLSTEDKLNILNTEETGYEAELDDTEIELINAIRNSKMTPQEYIGHMQQQGIYNYLNRAQPAQIEYSVDELSDEDLYIADLIAKVGDDLTDEEIQSMVDTAKANEAVFKKQIDAIRNEYRQLEDNNRRQTFEVQRQNKIENYNRFAESVETEIRDFTDVYGYSLNMDESEMEELYDFITGFDGAGVSVFGKALNDPKLLVQMAWFALNGERAFEDINSYWANEITNVRQTSYNKGVEDARNGKIKGKSSVAIRNTRGKNNNSFDDLDDF